MGRRECFDLARGSKLFAVLNDLQSDWHDVGKERTWGVHEPRLAQCLHSGYKLVTQNVPSSFKQLRSGQGNRAARSLVVR